MAAMNSIFMPTNRCIFCSPVAQPSGVLAFSVERDPDGQDDQDDRRNHRYEAKEFHRHHSAASSTAKAQPCR
jgi:hypothetical protein